MKTPLIPIAILALTSLSLPGCQTHAEEKGAHQEHQKIVVTTPLTKDVTITQPYVCQIRSQRYTAVKALQEGYLEEIPVKEGQAVKQGEVMFKIKPVLYQTRLDAERAKASLMQAKFDATLTLFERVPPVVSKQEVKLAQAELDEANAKVKTAEAELDFATVRAPFDGIIDRQEQQQGSLVKKEETLTTLSDNSVMRVYFNVPEVNYLEYQGGSGQDIVSGQIELVLANGSKFPQSCTSVTPMGKVNNETGNFAYRADFPNPGGLLRHGQTGKVLINRPLHDAVVIPQRATFETLDKRYVFVVGDDHVVHQREITVQYEQDDIFVIKQGLVVKDKIVLEGVRQVSDGEKKEFEFRKPEDALANQKRYAE